MKNAYKQARKRTGKMNSLICERFQADHITKVFVQQKF